MDSKSGRPEQSQTQLEPPGGEIPEAVPLVHGLVLGGRYAVEKLLGRGGMGLVVRAHDSKLGEPVAIKILRAELAAERRWIDRLAREVKLARQIRHPNVCRVFDFEQADGHTFLVMELATGGSLRTEIDSGALKARPLSARVADVRAITAGLAAIHEAGIVHRDVTPQNVLRMSDGRLVVSDFGLAIDASGTTTSIHGGTIAYMPPEVLRGAHANFASDVWALGVVMHEVVFGERPQWRNPTGEGLIAPRAELLVGERQALFDTCRACLREKPSERPRSAAALTAVGAGNLRVPSRHRRWPVVLVGLIALAVGGVIAQTRRTGSAVPRDQATPMITPTGEPADWTEASSVLATIDGRIRCIAMLPDHRTLRFAWGTPPRCEDLDIRTSRRTPSPVIPETCREGCPDLSSDGQRLVYQGYAPDGRAQAFVSAHPDGREPVAAVPIAEPSLLSEPKWLPRGDAFVYAADTKRIGVYSLATNRPTILPEPTLEPYLTSFFFVLRNRIFVSVPLAQTPIAQVVAFEWPSLSDAARFRVSESLINVSSPGDETLFASIGRVNRSAFVRITPRRKTAERIGIVRNQIILHSVFTENALIFVSVHGASDVWASDEHGDPRQLTIDGNSYHATPCGPDIALMVHEEDRLHVIRIDRAGRRIAQLAPGPRDLLPACSPDGKTWFFVRLEDGIFRCDSGGCRRVLQGSFYSMTMSPDGSRLALIVIPRGAPTVTWVSANGGPLHEVADTETGCEPSWSSNETLWISRRRGHDIIWTEVDANSGEPTGHTVRGSKDCMDGTDDPSSPEKGRVRAILRQISQIRTVSWPHPLSPPL